MGKVDLPHTLSDAYFDTDSLWRAAYGKTLCSSAMAEWRIAMKDRLPGDSPLKKEGDRPVACMENTPADFHSRGIEAAPKAWEDGLRISGGRPGEYEWWYIDARMTDGTIIAATYMVSVQPGAALGLLSASITAPDGKTHALNVPYKGYELASVSRREADIALGGNYLRGDLETYHSVTDPAALKGIGWDLTLRRVAPSYRRGTGYTSAGESYFGWFCAVPFGRVAGTLFYDGKTVSVEGEGYHDHNWGNIPMPVLIEDWWWGRMQLGEYTVVASNVHYAREYGGPLIPALAIFKGNELILDGAQRPEKIRFSQGNIQPHPDPKRGGRSEHTLPRTVSFRYEEGEHEATLTFEAGLMIGSTDLRPSPIFESLPADSPLRSRSLSPWYTRFSSRGTLTLALANAQEQVSGSGTLERMEFR